MACRHLYKQSARAFTVNAAKSQLLPHALNTPEQAVINDGTVMGQEVFIYIFVLI
jgi:hypothetical protein